MARQKWLTKRGRSLATIGAGAASGCLVEFWLHLLIENNAFFEPGRFRLGAPLQDGLVISQCVAASDCDIVQKLQDPVAIAANYLLTAGAFALLARFTDVGGLIAAMVGGLVISLVVTQHVDVFRSPIVVWIAVVLVSGACSAGWVLARQNRRSS